MNPKVSYQPDERPPTTLSIGLALQNVLQALPPLVIYPMILIQSMDPGTIDAHRAVFILLLVSGLAVILQTVRVGPIGSGLIVVTYPSVIAIPFCIIALVEGGTAVLMALLLTSGIVQIVVALRLSKLRGIVTPIVNGTITILLILSLVPIIVRSAGQMPDHASALAAPVTIAVTFGVMATMLLKGRGPWVVWAPLAGITLGCFASAAFGLYQVQDIASVPWLGLPDRLLPETLLHEGAAFWSTYLALLPPFLFLAALSVLQSSAVAVSTQRVSWRTTRALDYRSVQGATVGTGIANVLAAFGGIMPLVTISRGVAFVLQTRCAARHVGLLTGGFLVLLAFVPKIWFVFAAVPGPVSATFLALIVGPVLFEGFKQVVEEEPDFRTAFVVGASILIGLGFQAGPLTLPIGDVWNSLLSTAMTAGGLTLVGLTVLGVAGSRRTYRFQSPLNEETGQRLHAFLEHVADRRDYGENAQMRLQAAAEELIVYLTQDSASSEKPSRVRVALQDEPKHVRLEVATAPQGGQNLETQLALINATAVEEAAGNAWQETHSIEKDLTLRLLRHYATTVTHRQYHDIELFTIRVAR